LKGKKVKKTKQKSGMKDQKKKKKKKKKKVEDRQEQWGRWFVSLIVFVVVGELSLMAALFRGATWGRRFHNERSVRQTNDNRIRQHF
jgi:hypothetical protein